MQKRFVCLAKSTRDGELCIAGKEILPNGSLGHWFRPIGRNQECLPTQDCTFNIGHVVTCEISRHAPSPPQCENHIIANQPNWQIVKYFPKQYINSLADSPPSLWNIGVGCSSTHGTNDRVSEAIASTISNSLYFIRITDGIIIKKNQSLEGSQSTKIRLIFSYNNEQYSLVVTDPFFAGQYWNRLPVGESVEIGSCYITISLTRPFNGYCYKLIAGYIPSPFNLYTIGYSGFLLEDFIDVLKKESIGAIVDVRSSPYSSRFELYNITNIKDTLNNNNIFYLFLGDELGARPKDRSLYTNNVADFSKMAKSNIFINGCKRIREGLNKFPICLMCAEKDPATCHRTILVTNAFRNIYPEINIFHIHSSSKSEPQEKLDRRIMAMYNLEQEHFFKGFEDRKKEAYSLREKTIAYNDEN